MTGPAGMPDAWGGEAFGTQDTYLSVFPLPLGIAMLLPEHCNFEML